MHKPFINGHSARSLPETQQPFWANRKLLDSIITPCFVFDPARIVHSYHALRTALGTSLLVSLKAGPSSDVLACCAREFCDGVEVASRGELGMAAGRAPYTTYVTSPALDEALVLAACTAEANIVLDSSAHAELLVRTLPKLHAPPHVLIRINAAALLRGYTGSIRPDHFGVEPTSAATIARRLQSGGIDVVGLHVFAGSGSFSRAAPFMAAAISPVIEDVSTRLQQRLLCVNLGGGFTADWAMSASLMSKYRESIEPLQSKMTVLHEAGRAIFEPGAAFLTRVVSVKTIHGNHVAVCDGGMAHAFRLAMTEHLVKSPSMPLIVSARDPDALATHDFDNLPTCFVGNSCNPADVIGFLPKGASPLVGDIVVFDRCGAYLTYTPSRFLTLQPAQEYLVSSLLESTNTLPS